VRVYGVVCDIITTCIRHIQRPHERLGDRSRIFHPCRFWCCIFTARRYASAVLAVIMCLSIRPSVRPSVCLSHTCIMSKRLNVESWKQHRTVAQDSGFLSPKILAKFERGHPQPGPTVPQMQVGKLCRSLVRCSPVMHRAASQRAATHRTGVNEQAAFRRHRVRVRCSCGASVRAGAESVRGDVVALET